jgi:tetratricopeptide (TPR) repeat protein
MLSHAAQLALSSQEGASGVSRVDRPDERTIGPGITVSRYVIDSCRGAGGMGVVYAAYDPDLKRRVALKVLRHGVTRAAQPGAAQELVRREAMAMARLAHPNVVGIYDLFTTESALYIVMELIDGTTLTKWLREPRSSREVVSAFIAAGQGLAAAHAEGIIHRDFKPDNVLLATSGRVCVSDFGLSRFATEEASPSPHSAEGRESGLSMRHAGTPRYMSPEQHRGEPGTAKSDQFSFCVALYEGLYGELPFDAEGHGSWEVRAAPNGSTVPSWLRKSVLRGLSVDPQARYPTLDALFREIGEDPRRRVRRAWTISVLSALCLLAAPAALGYRRHVQEDACAHFDRSLTGVWDEPTKRSFEASGATLGPGRAKDAWSEIKTALDREALDWVEGRTLICKAAQANGTQVDARKACLDTRLEEFRALVQELPGAMSTDEQVSTALVAARKRLSAASCLTEPGRRPSFVEERTSDLSVDTRSAEIALARAVTLAWLGSFAESATAAESAVRLEDGAGQERQLALALYLAGGGHVRAGQRAEGMEDLRTGLSTADAAGDDQTRAEICTDLVRLSGLDPHVRSDPTVESNAAAWFAEGIAASQRHGDADGTQRATLHDAYALLLLGLGKNDQAIAEETLALPAFERVASSEHVATILGNRAGMLIQRGDLDGAAGDLRRAGDLLQAGGDPSRLAFIWTTLASLLIERTEFAQSEVLARRALSTLGAMGIHAESFDVAVASDALGEALLGLERYDDALAALVGSAATLGRLSAPEEVVMQVSTAVGRAHVGNGHPEEALPFLERATHTDTGDPATLAYAEFALAQALTMLAREPRRAKSLAASALERLDRIAKQTPLQTEMRERVGNWMTSSRRQLRSDG